MDGTIGQEQQDLVLVGTLHGLNIVLELGEEGSE